MSSYTSVVVGTDGSATSFLAVERAAVLARDSGARLEIVSAFTPASREEVADAEQALGGDAYLASGSNPAEESLQLAAQRAAKTGATDVHTHAVDGAPADVLRNAADEHSADLLVIGNKGLNSLSGRLLGSVPSEVARRSRVDVLIVHTT